MTTPPPQPPRWTDQDLQLAIELAWQSGREHIPQGLPEAIDDARHAAAAQPPTLTYEQRVAQRLIAIRGGTIDTLRSAPADEYRGGTVPWNGNRPQPAWLIEATQRLHRCDAETLDRARTSRPLWTEGDWRAVHRDVTPTVWWRIWWDLTPTTRNQLADLAPQGALAVEAVMNR